MFFICTLVSVVSVWNYYDIVLFKIFFLLTGTGKSHLIDRLREQLNNSSILICGNILEVVAYTGVAAFNVRGETLHSFLQLPINTTQFKELNGIGERRLQDRLSGELYSYY